eukprot:1189384-Prorocentrum_minimum.AAC.1
MEAGTASLARSTAAGSSPPSVNLARDSTRCLCFAKEEVTRVAAAFASTAAAAFASCRGGGYEG